MFFATSVGRIINENPYQLLFAKQISIEQLRWEFEIRLLLQSVIGNGTFALKGTKGIIDPDYAKNIHDDGLAFSESRTIPIIGGRNAGKYDYAHLKIHESKLLFLSCGASPTNSLPFQELTNIFDSSIWICIGVSMLIQLNNGNEVGYDSLVDGYSIRAEIPPSQMGGSCTKTQCAVYLDSCPRWDGELGDLLVIRNDRPAFKLGRDEQEGNGKWYCCPTPPVSPQECRNNIVVNTEYVKLVHTALQLTPILMMMKLDFTIALIMSTLM
ncbi:unnamed protein product [Orchesella dallaii]|uniref:Uncharacterized protein n=1 Tax=Orchesella dallaii TaxID=48710 RepID=A0ABP1RIK9_9HEXA